MRKILGVSVLVLVALAGCAKKDATHGTRLRLMSPVDIFETFIDRFEKENADIKVKWEAYYTADYYTKVQTEIAGNLAPDVIYFAQKSLADFGTRHALVDLRPYVEKDEIDLGRFYPQAFEEGEVESGAIYGFPVTGGSEVLYFNIDIFEQLDVQYPDGSWSWDTFLEASLRMTGDTDGDGRTDQYAIDARFVEYWAAALPWIWMNGGDLFNRERTECVVDSPESLSAVQFLIDLFGKHEVSPVGETVQTMQGVGFLSGKVAMNIYLPWSVVSQYSKIKHFTWDIAPVPKGKAGRIPRYTGECFSIWSGSRKKDEAWKLVKFLTSEKVAEEIARVGWMPSRKALADSACFVREETPWKEEIFVDGMNYARALPSVPYLGGQEGKLNSIWAVEMQLAMIGKRSVSDALREIEKKTNEELKTARK